MIILIETCFTTDVMSSEVFNSSDWLVMRCDRGNLGDLRRGGGVLIAVKRTLAALEILVENVTRIEQCWVRIQLPEYAVHLGAIYLPPGSDVSRYEQVVLSTKQVIDSSDAADRILVFGDFNCVLEWMPDSEDPYFMRVSDGPAVNVEFVDSMSALGLAQICNIRSRNQLDLIFTDLDGDFSVSRSRHPLKGDSYHHVSIDVSVSIREQLDAYDEDMAKYDFYKADLPALTAALSAINWVSALGNPQTDVDAAVNRLYVILRDLIKKHVPVKILGAVTIARRRILA